MSYSSDLWEGIEIIKANLQNQNKELKQLFFLFEGIASLEQEYSEGLSYLYDLHNKAYVEGALGESITTFLTYIQRQSQLHKKTYEHISQKILQPLDSNISYNMRDIREHLVKYEDNERSFNSSLKELLLKQEKFHEAAEEFSIATADTKISEISTTIKKSLKSKYLQVQSKKEESAKKAKAEYIAFLADVNKKRETYNNNTKSILNSLQTIHSNVISITQWCVAKFCENSLNVIKETESDEIQIKLNIESISPEKDIKDFAQRNATLRFPYYSFDFVPCKVKNLNTYVTQDNELEDDDCKQIIKEVRKYVSTELKYTPPIIEKNLETVYNNIERLTKLIWEQGKLDQEQRKQLVQYLKEKDNIHCFIKCLNKLRSGGKFLLTNISYNSLVDIFLAILNEKAYQSDYNVLKNVIILSQTFYKVGDNAASPNVLIQIGIQTHEIWHNASTWIEIIKYSIGEQDKKTRDKVMFSKGSDPNDERLKRLETFASTTLVSYLCNMKLFGVCKEVLQETEDFLCSVYHLNRDEITESVKSVSESEEKSNSVSAVKIGLSDNDVVPEHKENVKGVIANNDDKETNDNDKEG